jgi:hypothetical protein
MRLCKGISIALHMGENKGLKLLLGKVICVLVYASTQIISFVVNPTDSIPQLVSHAFDFQNAAKH